MSLCNNELQAMALCGCNKNAAIIAAAPMIEDEIADTTRRIFDVFDDDIDEMLEALAETRLTRQEAVHLSEITANVNVVRKAVGRELAVLPPTVHLQINEYAKRGMRKGQGRKGKGKWPRDSFLTKYLKGEVVEWGRELKEELYESERSSSVIKTHRGKVPMSKGQAGDKAAVQAYKLAEALGIKNFSVETIRDLMNRLKEI
jgi:hypothetical protein